MLFGKNMTCLDNVFYESPEKDVLINARSGVKCFTVRREIPQGKGTVTIKCPLQVEALIIALAKPLYDAEKKKVLGPGLSISKITGILYTLCENGSIPATFILHRREQDFIQ